MAIPNSVTLIGNQAFYNCSNLTSITIPNSVTSIGEEAFNGTGWLNNQRDGLIYLDKFLLGYKGIKPTGKLNIAEGTKGIAASAFYKCDGLTSVTIPNGVTTIENYTFYECSNLTSVTIPNSITSIGSYAFYGTGWLNNQRDGLIYLDKFLLGYKGIKPTGELNIAEGTKGIAAHAFYMCNDLTSVTIPYGITTIGNYTFYECSGLTSVTIPNTVTLIGYNAFEKCSNLLFVDIPNSVTSIGSEAFQDCSRLKYVTIGNGTKNISYRAFEGCTKLTNAYCLVDHISDGSSDSEGIFAAPNAFFGIYLENATLHVPASSIDAYKNTAPWCDFGNIVALTDEELDPSSIVLTNSDSSPNPIYYFNLDGKRISKPQRGLNIIKMSDGTTKKIIIK